MSQYSFSRAEHLKSTKLIDKVFREGGVYKKWPLRMHFLRCQLPDDDICFQAAFSVPKRNFKRAVDRNRLKRQIREAYRLHKATQTQSQYALVFVYSAKEKLPYTQIENSVKHLVAILDKDRANPT